MNETLKRALSGAVYVIVLLGCISYSREGLAILFGAFLVIGVYEFCKMCNLNLYVSIPVAAYSYYFLWNKNLDININTALTAITIVISLKLLLYLFNTNKTNFKTYTRYFLLFGYVIFPFILANYIAMGVKGYNPKILISIIILIWTNDTFAYLVGKNIGKNKLFPSVSPKKTIEGFGGGLVFTIIVGILLANYYIMASTLYIWIVIAAIVSIFSTLGDLIESKLKRVAGIKDTGNIMPGHGGILDRLDSIIFVIPFINLFYLILYYVS
jgi:phosphatidate cytidylyltransferase